MDSSGAIKQLRNGILPQSLNYSLENQTKEIDWSKVQYNAFYKSPDFFASKFPPEWIDTFPSFDKLVDIMASKAKTPIEEMDERNEKRETIINERRERSDAIDLTNLSLN